MDTRLKFKSKARAVVIVAHPDDETIWMGGFILKHPELNWTIMALCRASDADRAPKFRRVCERFGAAGIIEDADDEDRFEYEDKVKEIEQLVSKHFTGQSIDFLFTHGRNGEYGHQGHLAVHEAINSLISRGEISAGKVLFFNYAKTSRREYCKLKPAANSDLELKLDEKLFAAKRDVMTGIYGFAADGIDTGYCTNPEAFKILK